jgi:hypothetical protein
LNVKIEKYNKIIKDKNNCITSLENSINNLNNKIENIKPKIITDPLNINVYNILVLFKINDDTYYISRIQYQNYRQTLKFINDRYPNNKEIL